MNWTILIQSRPDTPDNRVLTALRMAVSAVADGETVSLFLTEGALDLARTHPGMDGERFRAQRDLLAEIVDLGVDVQACDMWLIPASTDGELLPGIVPSSMRHMIRKVQQADKVLTF